MNIRINSKIFIKIIEFETIIEFGRLELWWIKTWKISTRIKILTQGHFLN